MFFRCLSLCFMVFVFGLNCHIFFIL
jgi:hypothetical protein